MSTDTLDIQLIGGVQMVDCKTLSRYLGFKSPQTVRRMAASGKLPGVCLGVGSRQYWRFRLADIDRIFPKR